MNIHIISTPEFPEEQLSKIVGLLSSARGQLVFDKGDIWNKAQFSVVDKRFTDIESIPHISFNDYMNLVESYRTMKAIPADDFIILISTISHDRNWFSFFDGRNIFVHGAGWEQISDADPVFGIAYQCLENIFQSLIKIDIDYPDNEPNIHMESIGCINDYCKKKILILNKLRTADICDSCWNRAIQNGVDPKILKQIVDITEIIRQQFLTKRKFIEDIQPKKIHIDASAKIQIGDAVFEPKGEIPKLLFIYFLKHPEGVESKNLCSMKVELLRIYKLIKQKDDNVEFDQYTIIPLEITIENLCCGKGKDPNKIFRINKSRLNTELETLLGTNLAGHYQVQSTNLGSRNFLFKINLNHDHFSIDPRF